MAEIGKAKSKVADSGPYIPETDLFTEDGGSVNPLQHGQTLPKPMHWPDYSLKQMSPAPEKSSPEKKSTNKK